MVALVQMDQTVSFIEQLRSGEPGPITLANLFHVPPAHDAAFLSLWKEDADFMLAAGCLSGQLHKGLAGSTSYLNIAVWPDVATLARAFASPRFQDLIGRYPDGVTASPLAFQKVAVPGVCEA